MWDYSGANLIGPAGNDHSRPSCRRMRPEGSGRHGRCQPGEQFLGMILWRGRSPTATSSTGGHQKPSLSPAKYGWAWSRVRSAAAVIGAAEVGMPGIVIAPVCCPQAGR